MGERIRSSLRWVSLTLLVLAIAASGPSQAQQQGTGQPDAAQESVQTGTGNTTLQKTWLKAEDGGLSLSTTFANAFTDTTVVCPGSSGTCTVRVELSTQIWGVDPGQVARARVYVNGVLAAPQGGCCTNISTNASTWAETATMSWIAKSVPVGTRVVRVQLATSGGTADAGFRTLTASVFKP